MIRSLPNVIFWGDMAEHLQQEGNLWNFGTCTEAGLDQPIEVIKETSSIVTAGPKFGSMANLS